VLDFQEKITNFVNRRVCILMWMASETLTTHQGVFTWNLAANDSNALLFLFDLTNLPSLISIRGWYRLVRSSNRFAKVFLVGTKYDRFVILEDEKRGQILATAKKFARAMKSPLIFTSAKDDVNCTELLEGKNSSDFYPHLFFSYSRSRFKSSDWYPREISK
jgi:GTP-binding protein of the ras superfamily involved in termination of M-phase